MIDFSNSSIAESMGLTALGLGQTMFRLRIDAKQCLGDLEGSSKLVGLFLHRQHQRQR